MYINCLSVSDFHLSNAVKEAMVSFVCFLTKDEELKILIQRPRKRIEPNSGLMERCDEPNRREMGLKEKRALVSSWDLFLLIATHVMA